MTTDIELIQRAQQGESGAFDALLESYYETIYRVSYRWSGQASDADDITQLACIKLARSIGQFRFESSFTSWLYRLVINCAKDWQKAERRHQGDGLTEQGAHYSDGNQEPHTLLFQVLGLLDKMGKGMKETALLTLAEGLSQRETAEILKVAESTIAWRVHEIRKQLQPLVQRESQR